MPAAHHMPHAYILPMDASNKLGKKKKGRKKGKRKREQKRKGRKRKGGKRREKKREKKKHKNYRACVRPIPSDEQCDDFPFFPLPPYCLAGPMSISWYTPAGGGLWTGGGGMGYTSDP